MTSRAVPNPIPNLSHIPNPNPTPNPNPIRIPLPNPIPIPSPAPAPTPSPACTGATSFYLPAATGGLEAWAVQPQRGAVLCFPQARVRRTLSLAYLIPRLP